MSNLYFSNKTAADIILHDELDDVLGKNAHYIITDEKNTPFQKTYINKDFLMASTVKDSG